MGRTCCVQKLFLTFRTIPEHTNMFSTCSAKRRASDKDLPVQDVLHFFLLFLGWYCIDVNIVSYLENCTRSLRSYPKDVIA